MAPALRSRVAALIIGHPGHELRVHGWMEQSRPEVYVLTDGSGHAGRPRLDSTAAVLRRAGARPGPVFGRFSDRSLYQVIVDRDLGTLEEVVRVLAAGLISGGVEMVASDAIEGYNPAHDLCRVVADAAVCLAERRLGAAIARYDFLLEGRPDAVAGETVREAIRLELDDAALARKLAAGRSYPEMRYEVERNLAAHGEGAFRVECLRPADARAEIERLVDAPPFYERHGEQQVAAGHYQQVLRYREHFLPVARALRAFASPP